MDQERVLDIQTRNREHFQQAFARQLAVIGFRIDAEGNGIFQLGRWQEPEFPVAQPGYGRRMLTAFRKDGRMKFDPTDLDRKFGSRQAPHNSLQPVSGRFS